MTFRTIALTVLATVSLSAMTFAAEPEEAAQPNAEPATASIPAPEVADATEKSEHAAKDAEGMSPEEAAQAAVDGKIEYAEEKIDPHEATAAELAAYNATAAPDDKIICRKEMLTGSHRRVKVCMTVAQKRYLTEQTQRELATAGRNGAGDMRGE